MNDNPKPGKTAPNRRFVYFPLIYTRSIPGLTIDSITLCSGQTRDMGIFFERIPNRTIADARNYACERTIALKASHVLMADSDASWEQGSIDRLFAHDLPVVCGTMYTRDMPPNPTIGKFLRMEGDRTIYGYLDTLKRIKEVAERFELDKRQLLVNDLVLPRFENDLVEIDGCGMHFTMIKREVLEGMDPPWFKTGPDNAGEDFYFCRKAQMAGFKIWWDSGIHTGHVVGEERDFGIREFLFFAQFADEKYADKISGELEARLAK